MASDDGEVKDNLPFPQGSEPQRVSSPDKPGVRSAGLAVEEPWFSEAMEVSDNADGEEDPTVTGPGTPMGMKAEPIDLFEGLSKCSCCINWVKDQPFDAKENLEGTDEVKQHAVVVRRRKCHEKYSHEPLEVDSVVVNSPLIRTALEKIFSDYSAFDKETEDWTFQTPFTHFFHHWDEINAFIGSEDSGTSSSAHMKVLHGVLLPVLEEPLRLSKKLISQGLISYELLWTLFKPGQTIYRSGPAGCNEEHFLELKSSRYEQGSDNANAHYSLRSTMVDWDGNSFGLIDFISKIELFEGSKNITAIPFYPHKFVEDVKTVESRIIKQSYKFEQLAGINYVAYRGLADRRQIVRDLFERETEMLLDERIMVDAGSYYREGLNKRRLKTLNPYSKGQLRKHHSRDESAKEDDEEESNLPKGSLTKAQRMICSPWVKGYALKSKEWVSVLVSGVTDICWKNDAFDNLVLDQRYKSLIRGFVQSRDNKSKAFDDFIDGKGRGIVMLLAGPPGVGKTLTAEATAEDLHAPLYSFSAGQLGFDAEDVEHTLHKVLQLCQTWGAVLLLDEADVFLEQRTIYDLARNRLVSVFLRTLEYFEGVLFLTTNRLSDFDTAFESRIDLTLDFPALDYDSRLCIWRNLFAKVKLPVNLQEDDYAELAKVELNGRRIKNLIKSATVIAGNEEGSAVQRRHVNTILEVFAPKV